MSAFLGPIHFWLYNKIQGQLGMVDDIILLAKEKWNISLDEKLIKQYGIPERRLLDDVIDTGNIHGWLQTQVSDVENRLAFAVIELLKIDSTYIEELKSLFWLKGREAGLNLGQGVKIGKLYRIISDVWLDGMPCDHAYRIVEEAEDEITVQREICVHEQYWSNLGADISDYYILRNSWNEGLLDSQGVRVYWIDSNTYKISREETA